MKTDSSTVVQNLSASRMRIVVTSKYGEQWRGPLGEFVSANRAEFRLWRTMPRQLANQIRAFGETHLNLGCSGIFTLRAE